MAHNKYSPSRLCAAFVCLTELCVPYVYAISAVYYSAYPPHQSQTLCVQALCTHYLYGKNYQYKSVMNDVTQNATNTLLISASILPHLYMC